VAVGWVIQADDLTEAADTAARRPDSSSSSTRVIEDADLPRGERRLTA
jgi:hypothetical protein